jgi:phosphoribosylamine---glycine ligase
LFPKKNNIFIIGRGGREHALGWKLSDSPFAGKVYYAEGNGGTFPNVDIKPHELGRLVSFAKEHECFTVVGPEGPLAKGLVDLFITEGLSVLGPTKEAALLESSKAYAKHFMKENNIPTPNFRTFSKFEDAKDYVLTQTNQLVIKADGLAAGKGVFVCDTHEEALTALDLIMLKHEFGDAGKKIIVEDRLFGEEASFIAICDGKTVMPLASSKDHKRLLDNDLGPNTGGMGSYSPSPLIHPRLEERVMREIMEPVINGMRRKGQPFKGFLYAGIIIDNVRKQPYALEFNVRMGDPECQAIMMRLNSDLLGYLQAASEEKLDFMEPFGWKNEASVCIVMAAKGYPGSYETGKLIKGIDSCFGSDVRIFHAGTERDAANRVLTNGGRVLNVCALGTTIKEAADSAYGVAQKLSWGKDDQYFRTDIGRGIKPLF